ncbi:MAG: RND transporter [Pirellulales bacterium]
MRAMFPATLFFAALVLTAAWGCAPSEVAPSAATDPPADGAKTAEASDDHSGWWCPEHGVPEEECGLCDAKLAADFQRKGDWCKEHDRPDSQCFVCHPELEATFAARYEAKYGTQPPKPES